MVEPDPPTDAEVNLIHRLIAKDESALEELLTVYGLKVRGFLSKISSNELSPSEIDFVFNQAAINLWRFSDRIDPKRKTIRGWFLKIARNALMSYLRGEKRHAAVELQYEPQYDPAEDCEEDVPDVDSKEYKRLDALKDFIFNKLTGFERTIGINMFLSGGDPDIMRLARKYGKPRGNVDTVKSKVKKKIMDYMRNWDASNRKGKP
ncbi:MAG TPA: sigma-70 family RNA polymerase sigma factor [Pirellulaceae bacterium]|nr:sigma-70 family RNA polymerase sigma factor [Pirellulaceae bacterium]